MTNNLFVTFDVHDISRESSLVVAAIEELGQAVRVFSFLWYVRSNLSAAEAAQRVWDVMQSKDRLMVIDASSDEVASLNLDDRCLQSMAVRWHRELREFITVEVEPSRALVLVKDSTVRDIRAAAG